MGNSMGSLSVGYIRNPRADFVWFVALPFVAVAIGLGFHSFLPYVAAASVAAWVTIPHHYATWIRTYGLSDEWKRWRTRLEVGPLLLIPTVMLGAAFVPLTAALVLMMWDHQHSVMQQHGLARVYDFKAGTGSPVTGRFDLALHGVLYGNMLVAAPLWSELWIAGLYAWDLTIRPETVVRIHEASWAVTAAFAVVYLGHLVWWLSRGGRLNPMKYVFLLSSYSLWYYVSWQDSFLVYTVAHRIMHGVQYILMVWWYLDNKARRTGQRPRLLAHFNVGRFLVLGIVYALVFQLAFGAGLADFGFGLVDFEPYGKLLDFGDEGTRGFYAATAVNAAAALHYYVDSFIWKTRDARTREGL